MIMDKKLTVDWANWLTIYGALLHCFFSLPFSSLSTFRVEEWNGVRCVPSVHFINSLSAGSRGNNRRMQECEIVEIFISNKCGSEKWVVAAVTTVICLCRLLCRCYASPFVSRLNYGSISCWVSFCHCQLIFYLLKAYFCYLIVTASLWLIARFIRSENSHIYSDY